MAAEQLADIYMRGAPPATMCLIGQEYSADCATAAHSVIVGIEMLYSSCITSVFECVFVCVHVRACVRVSVSRM